MGAEGPRGYSPLLGAPFTCMEKMTTVKQTAVVMPTAMMTASVL